MLVAITLMIAFLVFWIFLHCITLQPNMDTPICVYCDLKFVKRKDFHGGHDKVRLDIKLHISESHSTSVDAHKCFNPANKKHLYNICTMLNQRRRRWADVV